MSSDPISPISKSMQLNLYHCMIQIREFEEQVQRSFLEGLIQGTTHLCQGQEAVCAGACLALREDDFVTNTYRGHGHCLARGMNMEAAFAELFGRATGLCSGLGGSMHFTDISRGLLGAFGIVGAGLPVAAGAGLAVVKAGRANAPGTECVAVRGMAVLAGRSVGCRWLRVMVRQAGHSRCRRGGDVGVANVDSPMHCSAPYDEFNECLFRVHPMTLVQLRHLVSLAQSGSFTRSAEALFVTQPALSRSIRALEEELGQPLFDRIGRRSVLTPFGAEALRRARQVLFDADELAGSGRQMREGHAGAVRIGLGSGPGAMLTTSLLKTMAISHPSVHLEIARGHIDALAHRLRQRELDALVIDARSLSPSPDLRVASLVEMRGAIMVRPGHPLTRGHKGPLRFDALRQFPIASTPLSDDVARALVERYGPAAHPAECATLRCEEIASLVEVVRQTDAVLIAIRAAAPDLVELPMRPAMNATARFGIATLARRAEPPALPIVRRLIAELMRD